MKMNSVINFYQVTSATFEKSVCQLLEKCYQTGKNTLVKVGDVDFQELINKTLWTFSQKSFIPHGSINDPLPNQQPILITDKENNINNADILVCIGCEFDKIDQFSRIMIIFYEHNNLQREICRNLYLKYKALSYEIKYYKQLENGAWS